ncbi:MAG: hypothetical protein GXN91_04855 [Epsilonproteobacteria bacterium]|nr:hypothetical protein [Campylobacterota bacterium]
MRFLQILLLLFLVNLGAKNLTMPKDFRMVPIKEAQILQEGENKLFCPRCGMTLPMFYRTNHAAKVDGKWEQYCSIYCLVDTMNMGKEPKEIKVVDNTTLKFIDAGSAFYVVGSKKPATMSKTSFYAFGTKEAADKFANENGGKVMSFNEALEIAKKEFEADKKAVAARQAKMAKMGKMVYNKMCQKIDEKFNSVAQAKSYIIKNKSCPNLKGKELQAVAIYLYKGEK